MVKVFLAKSKTLLKAFFVEKSGGVIKDWLGFAAQLNTQNTETPKYGR
jgi:hypothetical protein